MEETLICQNGNHPFTRERKRGRKPAFCPEHQPVTSIEDNEDAPKKEPSVPKIANTLELRIRRVLNSTSANQEAQRKLAYAYEQLKIGRETYIMNQVVNDVLRQEEQHLALVEK